MHLGGRVWETQSTILEGAVDVVDVLRVPTVVHRGVQDHDGASMYYEARDGLATGRNGRDSRRGR
jgi:hypothetical protein